MPVRRRAGAPTASARKRPRTAAVAAEPEPRLESVFEFDLELVRRALDAQRTARGLSWAAAARQINRLDEGVAWTHGIATSSVSKLGHNKSGVAEGDGVLQMLLWLGRSPESFLAPQLRDFDANPAYRLRPTRGQILRWDTQKLHRALDMKRRAEGRSWSNLANHVGWKSGAALSRLAKGGRVSFPAVMRLPVWLGSPVASFTTDDPHPTEV